MDAKGLQAAVTSPRAARLPLLLLALAACGPTAGVQQEPQRREANPGERDYVAPPELSEVSVSPDRHLTLAGAAAPGARVRIATPDGAAATTVADAAGRWRLPAPGSAGPRLLGLSMTVQGRTVQAQGYLFVAPDGSAARLRAGGGGETVPPRPSPPNIETVDYDRAAGAVVSGRTGPGETVTMRVDGVQRGAAMADGAGRYVLALASPLSFGQHDLALATASGQAHVSVTVDAAAPLTRSPFRAAQTAYGWRIDWLTPGGGEQTTLIIQSAEPRL
ncbi:MAG: hypothetical protein ACHP84_16240 [Caulobacterales bacterium]